MFLRMLQSLTTNLLIRRRCWLGRATWEKCSAEMSVVWNFKSDSVSHDHVCTIKMADGNISKILTTPT